MIKLQWISALSLAAALISAPAFAQGTGQQDGTRPAQPRFGGLLTQLDTNKDGKITRAEALGAKHEHLRKLDANGDGAVTLAEAEAARKAWREQHKGQAPRADKARRGNRGGKADGARRGTPRTEAERAERVAQRFEAQDQNKDGKLSKSETRMPEQRFDALDVNKDGLLSLDEFSKGRRQGPGKARSGGGMFARLDTNKDGKVTQSEATAGVDRLFERLDTNKDGVLAGDELSFKRGHQDRARAPRAR